MKSKLFILFLVLNMVLGLSGFLQAESTITQVTNNTYEDSLPQIKGSYLVWQGYDEGDWEIFLYDIVTKETHQITDNTYDDLNPQTDGRYVVWWADKPSGAEIWLYSIDTEEKSQISPADGKNHYLPVIANGRIAWMGFTPGEAAQRDIFLYDVLNGVQQLTDNNLDDSSPRISDAEVIWVQTDEQGNSTVFTYDFAGNTRPAQNGVVWEDRRQSGGIGRVLTRYDGQDWEIMIQNRDQKVLEYVTDNTIDDEYPCINGNKIAWVAGEGKMREIFLAEYKYLALINPRDNALLSRMQSPTFTWEGISYDKFKVQFSPNEDCEGIRTFTLPLRRRTWLSKTSLTPSRWEWRLIRRIAQRNGCIYWRVKGKDSEGNEILSEIRSFSIESGRDTAPGS